MEPTLPLTRCMFVVRMPHCGFFHRNEQWCLKNICTTLQQNYIFYACIVKLTKMIIFNETDQINFIVNVSMQIAYSECVNITT